MIKLEQNYRSSGRFEAANILIANNPHVFSERLVLQLGYAHRSGSFSE
ncbi:hypothetical protein ACNKHV_23975 [Shigella flexneri]